MVDAFALARTPTQVNTRLHRYDEVAERVGLFPTVVQVSEGPLPERFTLVPRHCMSAAA
jgi:hypothetical protein